LAAPELNGADLHEGTGNTPDGVRLRTAMLKRLRKGTDVPIDVPADELLARERFYRGVQKVSEAVG
jgi:hypothetical protein